MVEELQGRTKQELSWCCLYIPCAQNTIKTLPFSTPTSLLYSPGIDWYNKTIVIMYLVLKAITWISLARGQAATYHCSFTSVWQIWWGVQGWALADREQRSGRLYSILSLGKNSPCFSCQTAPGQTLTAWEIVSNSDAIQFCLKMWQEKPFHSHNN